MLNTLLLISMTLGAYGRVSYVREGVEIIRNGTSQPLTINFLVEPGDVVITNDGRIELEFRYKTIVWLGRNTEFLVHRIERDIREFEITEGKMTVANKDLGIVRVVIPQGSIELDEETRVRIRVNPSGAVKLKVTEGKVYVDTDEMSTVVYDGETIKIDEFGDLAYRVDWRDDDFYRWCHERYTRYVVEVEYVYLRPVIWVGYWDLTPYGRWVWMPPYGWVWIPYVSVGWSPYYHGYWTYSIYFGWVWVSYEPWGWIPYHFGRWAYMPGYGWVWVPGYRFSGAWVGWHVERGYVAWAPLGPNNRIVRGPDNSPAWIAVTKTSFENPKVKPVTKDFTKVFAYEKANVDMKRVRKWDKKLKLEPKESYFARKSITNPINKFYTENKEHKKVNSDLKKSSYNERSNKNVLKGSKHSRKTYTETFEESKTKKGASTKNLDKKIKGREYKSTKKSDRIRVKEKRSSIFEDIKNIFRSHQTKTKPKENKEASKKFRLTEPKKKELSKGSRTIDRRWKLTDNKKR